MLLLHEVHTLAGRHEDEFEQSVRTGWMPRSPTATTRVSSIT